MTEDLPQFVVADLGPRLEPNGHMVGFSTVLNIQDSNIPLPHMQRVADVEELFPPVQLEFV